MKYAVWLFGTTITQDYTITFTIQDECYLLGQVELSGNDDNTIFLALEQFDFLGKLDFLIPNDLKKYSDELNIMRGKNTFVLFWEPFEVPIGFLEPI